MGKSTHFFHCTIALKLEKNTITSEAKINVFGNFFNTSVLLYSKKNFISLWGKPCARWLVKFHVILWKVISRMFSRFCVTYTIYYTYSIRDEFPAVPPSLVCMISLRVSVTLSNKPKILWSTNGDPVLISEVKANDNNFRRSGCVTHGILSIQTSKSWPATSSEFECCPIICVNSLINWWNSLL